MERFEGIRLLAHTDELDRFAGYFFRAQCGSASGIAVEFRHYDTVNAELIVESLRRVDGVLSCESIDHEKYLVRFYFFFQPCQLFHVCWPMLF